MRSLSARDILLALPHIKSEVALIHPDNDVEVFAVLDAVGFDSKRGIEYVVANHRDMKQNTGVGFIAVGEYNTDPKFKNFIDTTDRTILRGMEDPSFAQELSIIMGKRFTYKNQDEDVSKPRKRPEDPRYYSQDQLEELGYFDGDEEAEEYDEVEDNYDAIVSQIKVLEDIRKQLRGV